MNHIERYFDHFDKPIRQIEASLNSYWHAVDDCELRPHIEHALGIKCTGLTKSKRLRGVLLIETSAAMKTDGQELALVSLAAAVEVVHCASLVFDDLQDGHTERWGQPTLWVESGHAMAMNIGLLLVSLAAQQIRQQSPDSIAAFHDALVRMSLGQALDIDAKRLYPTGMEGYERIVSGKTTALFECAGSLACRGKQVQKTKLVSEWARAFGLAHQMQDDLDDVCATHRWQEVSSSNVCWFVPGERSTPATRDGIIATVNELVRQQISHAKGLAKDIAANEAGEERLLDLLRTIAHVRESSSVVACSLKT